MKLNRFKRWVKWGLENKDPDFPSRLLEVGGRVVERNPSLIRYLPRELQKIKELFPQMESLETIAFEILIEKLEKLRPKVKIRLNLR